MAHQQKVARYFNKQLKARTLFVGDMVLRRVFLNTKDNTADVLGPTWEGVVYRNGTFYIYQLTSARIFIVVWRL